MEVAMRKKSLLAVAISAAALAGLSAGPAFAGEITGPPGTVGEVGSAPGTPTPVASGVAASECSFNGLNDFNQGHVDRITQNYGTNKKLGIPIELGGFPGTDCNPTRAG
jgi:hypothetical protein